MRFPDGRLHPGGIAVGVGPVIEIHDPHAVFLRLGRYGSLGFGEAFLARDWDVPGMDTVSKESGDVLARWFEGYARNLREADTSIRRLGKRILRATLPSSERNTRDGAQRNISVHYDMSPEFFALFLDSQLVYSSARFEPGDELDAAQLRKLDDMLDIAGVGRDTRLLDIGCGYGALAVRAAELRGATVVGISLSRAQLSVGEERLAARGLDGQVRLLHEDFRDHSGRYDAATCVEMIEAVGPENWRVLFRKIDSLLAPGGRAALQVITYPHDRMKASLRDFSWVDRYVFPGGALPSLREIDRILSRETTLEIVSARRISSSYADTLKAWRHRFVEKSDEVKALGFDDVFTRLWVLYLAYFEGGFRSRHLDVWQLGLARREL